MGDVAPGAGVWERQKSQQVVPPIVSAKLDASAPTSSSISEFRRGDLCEGEPNVVKRKSRSALAAVSILVGSLGHEPKPARSARKEQ